MLDKDFLTGIVVLPQNGMQKVVLTTAERADAAVLTLADGTMYSASSNKEEPFDFTTHVFWLPPTATLTDATLSVTSRAKKETRYFAARGARDVLAISRDVTCTDTETLRAASDSGLVYGAQSTQTLADGVQYTEILATNKSGAPVVLHVLRVQREKARFATGLPANGGNISTVEAQARAHGGTVIAAVNADFFDMFGDCHPSGLCVQGGKVIANPDTTRPFFGVTRDGTPVITTLAAHPELRTALEMAVGGREIFLQNGALAEWSPAEPFSYVTHPRTAAGITATGDVLLLVVDGRRSWYSNGATLVDLSEIMRHLGAKTAINLDGGGSSTCLVREMDTFVLKNHPADLHRPTEDIVREVYNSVLVTLE